MTAKLEKAKELLEHNDCALVILNDGEKIFSNENGLKALVRLIDGGAKLKNAAAADKIVGRAAALLYAYAGVSGVFGQTMSEGGKAVLEAAGIECCCSTLTETIINRAGTGPCPMDAAVEGINNPEKAFEAIKNKAIQLGG